MRTAIEVVELPSPRARALPRPTRFSAWVGLVVAVLVAAVSLAGASDASVYAREAASWRTQAIAQDRIDLVACVPWLAIAAVLVLRGSTRARLALAGGLAYTAYSFVLYATSVHFNALFLIYVAILGLAAWSLGALLLALPAPAPARASRVPRRIIAGFLIASAACFGALWLATDLAATVRGTVPAEITEAGLPANPVHVLDLAFALPAMIAIGVALVRRRPAALALASVALGFLALMTLNIGAMVGAAGSNAMPAVFGALASVAGYLMYETLAAFPKEP